MTKQFTEETLVKTTNPKAGEEYWLMEITRAYDNGQGTVEMWSHGAIETNHDRELTLMRVLCAVENGNNKLNLDPELRGRAWTHATIHSIRHDGVSLLSSVCVPYRSGIKNAISAISRLWADVTGDKELELPRILVDVATDIPKNVFPLHDKTTDEDPRGVAEILDVVRENPTTAEGWALMWEEKKDGASVGATKVWDCNPVDDSLKAFLDEIEPIDVKLYRIKSGKMLLKSKWFSKDNNMDMLTVWHGIVKDVKTEMRRCLN